MERLQREGIMHLEALHRHKDGHLFSVEVSTTLFTLNGRQLILGIDRDVTERKRTDEALRASEASLSEALKAAKLAYWEFDIPNNVFVFNDHFYSIFHTTAQQEGGYTMSMACYTQRFCHPEDVAFIGTEIQKAASSTDRYYSAQLDHRILYADGSIGYVSARMNVDRDETGRILRIYGANQDITERKHAEEAARLSEERFQLVTYATNDAVWDLNLVTGQRWWNAGIHPLFGYTADQIGSDQAWWEARIHEDDRPRVLKSFQAALDGDGQFWSKEYRYQRADGTYAYVFDRGYIMTNSDGLPVRVIGAMVDLSERKRIEEALRQSEEMFSRAFEASPAPMTITTLEDGLFIDVNGSWERLFGYERQEIIGRHILDFPIYINSEDRVNFLNQIQKQGKLEDFEIRIQVKSGEERDLLTSAQLVEMQGQTCLLCAFYDTTELRRMHEAMLASQKLADLGTLAAGVAHEMNSPLQVITGVSQSLLRKSEAGNLEPEKLKHDLDVIHRNGWRCAEIVRSLHTYARASGSLMQPTDLNELVQDSLLLIEHQLKSWASITVTIELASNLPPLTCDRNQITQVLINLLTNARDAMPQGGEITVGTSYDPQADQLLLLVKDTGTGIPDSIRAKIFDPFFTTKPLGKGTGLGLSILTGIVRAHGGTIAVDSVAGRGTVFNIHFPVQPLKLQTSQSSDTPGRFDDIPALILASVGPISTNQEKSHDQNFTG